MNLEDRQVLLSKKPPDQLSKIPSNPYKFAHPMRLRGIQEQRMLSCAPLI